MIIQAKIVSPAVEWCSKLKKRSHGNAAVISSLFPSIASRKRKFDPYGSEAVPKKATIPHLKGRSKTLTIVVLKQIMLTIPKKEIRENLRKEGRIKELGFHRIMSSSEVQVLVLKVFKSINLENFQYLKCCKDSHLIVFEKQKLDGNGVIALAGCGCLYLQELPSSSCSITKVTAIATRPTASIAVLSTPNFVRSTVTTISTTATATSSITAATSNMAISTTATSMSTSTRMSRITVPTASALANDCEIINDNGKVLNTAEVIMYNFRFIIFAYITFIIRRINQQM